MDLYSFFSNKSILVYGGTGTIGSEIVSQLLQYNPKVIRIFSNSENELWETGLRFKKYTENLRFLLGDIRNADRVTIASNNIDYVFNAAAIKHVPISEYNPMEAITVNIIGLNNVIEAAFNSDVKKVIHISTDKAVSPTTVMGATKMLGERLCISKSLSKGTHKTIVSCVRFGNVLGSRGSIIPLVKNQIENGNQITITGDKMRRFFMPLSNAIGLIIKAMVLSQGNEIFIHKMKCIAIKDLIEVIIEEYAPRIGKNPSDFKIVDIGPRIGEKFDEELISPIEYTTCYDLEDMFTIYPTIDLGVEIKLPNTISSKKITCDNDYYRYSTEFQPVISKSDIRKLLNENNLL